MAPRILPGVSSLFSAWLGSDLVFFPCSSHKLEVRVCPPGLEWVSPKAAVTDIELVEDQERVVVGFEKVSHVALPSASQCWCVRSRGAPVISGCIWNVSGLSSRVVRLSFEAAQGALSLPMATGLSSPRDPLRHGR